MNNFLSTFFIFSHFRTEGILNTNCYSELLVAAIPNQITKQKNERSFEMPTKIGLLFYLTQTNCVCGFFFLIVCYSRYNQQNQFHRTKFELTQKTNNRRESKKKKQHRNTANEIIYTQKMSEDYVENCSICITRCG